MDEQVPIRSRRRWGLGLTFAAALLICGWFVTWGDGKFFEHDGLASFYDAQALSIMTGHLDVPREAIGFEAYMFNGKAYGYFGIAPALLRIPLLIAFPHLDGLWSRSMMMMACLLTLIAVDRILRKIRGPDGGSRHAQLPRSLFLLSAALGSTNLFIISRSYVFHEAIMWSSTFALLFAWVLLRYLETPSRRLLALTGGLAFMSFHSRATAGAGALLAMSVLTVVLIWRTMGRRDAGKAFLGFQPIAQPGSHAGIAALILMATLGVYLGVNFAKFGTLGSMPLRYYDLYAQAPSRMEITGAEQIHPENIPTTLVTYFGPRGLEFQDHFPWLGLAAKATKIGSPSIDVVEGFSSFPVSMPALTMLALAGCLFFFRGSTEPIRRARLPAAALFAGGGVVFMTVGITERYLHDLYPALIICAAVGVRAIDWANYSRVKIALLFVFTIFGIALNSSFALTNQRAGSWGVPAQKQAEFIHFQQSVDRFLHRNAKGHIR